MRRKLLAANWKLNKTLAEAMAYAEQAKELLAGFDAAIDIAVCAPFPLLIPLAECLKGAGIAAGAQNVSEYVIGAYTGETGVKQLADCGLEYVILGHSERRNVFGETDNVVRRKLEIVLSNSELAPILCVGEPLDVREGGGEEAFVARQMDAALSGLHPARAGSIVIAYEPIWAIGTGANATPDDAQTMCLAIRRMAADILTPETAGALRILYGGSIKPSNWADIAAGPDVDGGLVGGASLDINDFAELCRISCAAGA